MVRAVFMGTPDFALPSLLITAERTELALVVTQPDKPAGRGRKLHPPPVKVKAQELGFEVAQPVASVTRELGPRLVELEPDVIVVAAFGKFLGRKVLGTPRLGCINVHASLLPRHRGASPPVWAIMSGDAETGVTIQQMVPKMDAGDVVARMVTPIEPDETAGDLTARLSSLGGELLASVLSGIEAGSITGEPQDHDAATLAPPLSKTDGHIDWTKPARVVHDHVRAMNPWPVAFSFCGQGRLRIHRTHLSETEGVQGVPGEVIRADKHGIHIACGQGSVEIIEAQRDGKAVTSAVSLVCGRLLSPGECFEGEESEKKCP